MEESTPQSSSPIEFVIPENQGYAMTDIRICEAIEFLMAKLEEVNLDDLDPDDRQCLICQEEFDDSEDETLSHTPVKTVCGHIFGKACLIKWLDPLCFWNEDPDVIDMDTLVFKSSQTSCPKCRHVFYPKCQQELLQCLEMRLWFWDMAYASAGISRSDREVRSRKYLWEYVKYSELYAGENLDGRILDDLELETQSLLLQFAQSLKAQTLTPEQERRRKWLERIGEANLVKCDIKSDGTYNFNFDRDEDIEMEMEEAYWPRRQQPGRI